MPLTWTEVDDGARIEEFRLDNVPALVAKRGDLWAPLVQPGGRFDLERDLRSRLR
jgi:DNA primase